MPEPEKGKEGAPGSPNPAEKGGADQGEAWKRVTQEKEQLKAELEERNKKYEELQAKVAELEKGANRGGSSEQGKRTNFWKDPDAAIDELINRVESVGGRLAMDDTKRAEQEALQEYRESLGMKGVWKEEADWVKAMKDTAKQNGMPENMSPAQRQAVVNHLIRSNRKAIELHAAKAARELPDDGDTLPRGEATAPAGSGSTRLSKEEEYAAQMFEVTPEEYAAQRHVVGGR